MTKKALKAKKAFVAKSDKNVILKKDKIQKWPTIEIEPDAETKLLFEKLTAEIVEISM